MKKLDENLLTASEVANKLNVSVKTLTNWYIWQNDSSIEKPEEYPHLPMYTQKRKNGPRFWTNDDVERLVEFRDWLPRGRNGVMGKVSNRYWGNRSKNND